MDNIFKPKFNEEKNDFIFTNIKRKCNTAMLLVVVFIFSVTTAYAVPQYNYITIVDGDYEVNIYTEKPSVEEAIFEQGITLSEFDEVIPGRLSDVYDGMHITIERFKKVNVSYDGYDVSYYTKADTYREFIKENSISLSVNDLINVDLDDKLQNDNEITIKKVTRYNEEISQDIPYSTTRVKDATLEKGKTKLRQKGVNGIKKVNCEVVYKDGVEIERNIVSEYIEKYPVNEIIAVGTKAKAVSKPSASSANQNTSYNQTPSVPVSSGSLTATVSGHTFNYKKVLTCSATAYDLSFESTGKRPGQPGYGITASGTYAKVGTVAVDPRVIPLGTKMYIVSTDGKYVYGYCTAEDTGGAIKGNKVDLFYNTNAECLQFGRRSVYVYIL